MKFYETLFRIFHYHSNKHIKKFSLENVWHFTQLPHCICGLVMTYGDIDLG